MTIRTVIHCNGNWGNRACRNTLSLGPAPAAKARERSLTHDWTSERNLDYCPSCSRRRASIRGRAS